MLAVLIMHNYLECTKTYSHREHRRESTVNTFNWLLQQLILLYISECEIVCHTLVARFSLWTESCDRTSCWVDEACGIDDTPWSPCIEYRKWELFSGGLSSCLYIRGFIVRGPGPNNDMFSFSEVNLLVVGTKAAALTGCCLVKTLGGWDW